MNKEFEIKDLRGLKYFSGIKVARFKNGIFICQRKHTLDLLDETRMMGAKPIETPMKQNHGPSSDSGELPDDLVMYQSLIRRLIYLTITQPNIGFVVSVMSQFMHAPCLEHLKVVYQILKYLKAKA